MTLNPMFLPRKTNKVYKLGVGAWPLVVQTAIEEGVRDIDCLTDIVFYLHHPEMGCRPLASVETGLIDQWKHFRGLVRQRVPANTYHSNGIMVGMADGPVRSSSRIWGWEKTQEIRSGSQASVRGYDQTHRMWRSRNGPLIDGRSSGIDMWSWHEAARMGAFDPPFRGGVFVAS